MPTVLIVDDSAAIRTAIKNLLHSQTTLKVCGEAADGIEAIKKIENLKPDLVILDFSMPRMNGMQVARELRKRAFEMPIILFTWHADAMPKGEPAHLSLHLQSKDDFPALVRSAETLLGIPT